MSEQNDFFWVIFDTCTKPQYYEDVHNILALPEGSVYRYEYRLSHMSPSATQAATSQMLGKVLLVYAQANDYHKGDTTPVAETPAVLWIATRVADVTLIPSQEGKTFYFDLRLEKYPRVDQGILLNILKPLIDSGETPFRKWVTTSRDFNNFNELCSGEDDDNWESIIDLLGRSPSQFAGDAFWRLRTPIQVDNGKKLRVRYQKIPIRGTSEIRQVNSYYEAEEGLKGAFELVSYIPVNRPNAPTPTVQISANDKDPVYVVGASRFDLRPHSAVMLKFATSRSELVTASTGSIRIETDHDEHGWPLGPKLGIELRVFKPVWKITIAGVLFLIAAYLVSLGLAWIDQNPNVTIAAGMLSFVTGAIAYYLLFAKLKMPEA